jgi:HAD superfamily hydrolase (TIGR01549 family)
VRGLILDLDGTLVDTVYAHVFAWQRAFAEAGLGVDGWRIHRRSGMSDRLFALGAARESGHEIDSATAEVVQRRHGELFREILPERRALPGAVQLLSELRRRNIAYGIATSGHRPDIDRSLRVLGVGEDAVVVDGDDVVHAKPEPDLFSACQQRLGLAASDCYVVGDAVWDQLAARRAGILSVGLLSGGYGEAELLGALDELGMPL